MSQEIIKDVLITPANSWRGRKMVRLPKGYRVMSLTILTGSLQLRRVPMGPIYAMPSGIVVNAHQMEAGDRLQVVALIP
jgi:hypothetical protein